jgi:hypothetical protein
MEKMLTPVEERPTEVEEGRSSPLSDDDDIESDSHIVPLNSQKIDGMVTSRSASGLSNPNASWGSSDVSSTKDTVSILSGVGDERQRSGSVDKTKEEILGRQSQQESAKDLLLSQSSDDDCCPLVPSVFDKMASSAEETASQQIPDSPHRHDVFADQSPRPFQKHNSLREGGSQRSSPLSSTSHATVSSQSSYSEITGDEGDQRLRKYSVSKKYARYEAYRASMVVDDPPVDDDEKSSDPHGGYSQSSTQESVATVTNEHNILEDTDVDRSDGVGGKEHWKESVVNKERERSFSEGVNAHLLDRRLSDMKDSLKHCDSGIDETPDANKTFKDGIRRFSVPPSSEDGVMMMPDPLPLSRTLVASRESGLADSPDPESFADEVSMLKVSRRPPQSAGSTPTHKPHSRAEVEIYVMQGSGGVEDDEEDGVAGSIRSDRFSTSYERPRSVPRSLENPSFSRYARTPIRDRDSKFIKSGEFQETGGLKYRSVSMDRISSTFSSGETERSVTSPPRSNTITSPSRAHAMSASRSAAVLLAPINQPLRQPIPVQANNNHPNQRFCVNPELSPPSPLSPSSVLPNLNPDLYSPSSSPTTSRGKKIKEKLKPALRVFKIASSSAESSSPVLQTPPLESDEQGIPSTPDTPDSSVELSPLALGSGRRARMASPDSASMCSSPLGRDTLRRSQSSEDILDSRVRIGGEEGDEEGRGVRDMDNTAAGLLVIPEPKFKSRKFFGKFKGRRGVHKRGISSPVVLTKYGYHSINDGPGLSTSVSFSAMETNEQKRHKKRHHRTPHFV